MAGQTKSDVGGRAEFVGKKLNRHKKGVGGGMLTSEEINKTLDEEFNPVKNKLEGMSAKELLEAFAEYYYSNNRSVQPIGLHVDSFLEQFNPVKTETEQPQPEQPGVKTTAAYDNSRLEFLRMQIGTVQNFYQTLGNILYSLSMRLDVAEAKIESLKAQHDQIHLERQLYKRYGEYCKENNLQWSEKGFIDFIRAYAEEEEQNETRTNANKTDTH